MSIKRKFLSLLPAYRSKDAIMDELYNISSRITLLEERIKSMDKKNEYLFYCLQHLNGETDLETKKRVLLSLPKAGGQIRDFQIVANHILRRVKKICEDNNIDFSLDGGTLLGAVRHKGFIPWDDDVDISLLHEDYYRLEEAINHDEELVMKRYYRYLGKGTQASYVTKIKLKTSDLFFVDVFPRNCYYTTSEKYEEDWQKIVSKERQFKDDLNKLFDLYSFEHTELDYKPRTFDELDYAVEKLEKKYQEFFLENNLKREGNPYCCLSPENDYGAFIRQKLLPFSIYFPLRKNLCEFEGEYYSCFNEYNAWLEMWYGDYWSLPREIVQTHLSEMQLFSQEDRNVVERIKKYDK